MKIDFKQAVKLRNRFYYAYQLALLFLYRNRLALYLMFRAIYIVHKNRLIPYFLQPTFELME